MHGSTNFLVKSSRKLLDKKDITRNNGILEMLEGLVFLSQLFQLTHECRSLRRDM